MELMEKVFSVFDSFRIRELQRKKALQKLDATKKTTEQKLLAAQGKLLAKDYFEYAKTIRQEFSKLKQSVLKQHSWTEFVNDYANFKYFLQDEIRVPAKEFFESAAEFLTLQTGRYFTVKKEIEKKFASYGHGHGEYYDVNVFKIYNKDQVVFQSDTFALKDTNFHQHIFPYPAASISHKYGNLYLVLPFEKAKNYFAFIAENWGYGFGEDTKDNFRVIKSRSDCKYYQVKKVAPEFNTDKLTDFIIDYINKNCKLTKQFPVIKSANSKPIKDFESDM